jgi:hypothetical protein
MNTPYPFRRGLIAQHVALRSGARLPAAPQKPTPADAAQPQRAADVPPRDAPRPPISEAATMRWWTRL